MGAQKLYVVVRDDLPPGPQAVQSDHSVLQFAIEHPILTYLWYRRSNHIALLSVPDESALKSLSARAKNLGIRHSIFTEPDLGDSWTSVTFEPGEKSRLLCKGFPLALKE